ncbi:MAG: S41 family peptidase [Anaerolineae bacterium]|nr:S41 family peptidase [Anaerolineae bacterium]
MLSRTVRMLLISTAITTALVVAFAAGVAITYMLMHDQASVVAQGRDLGVFWEAWDLVERVFYGNLPDNKHLEWGIIRGALGTLNDPHTSFLEPEPRQREKEALSGRFGGIGAYVTQVEDGRIVLEPMPDLPAEKAGVRKGDTLLKVDNIEIEPGTNTEDVIAHIRGEVGTVVQLTLRHEGETEPVTVEITREEIPTPTVEWRMLDEPVGTGYIRLTLFSDRTDKELRQALDELKGQGMIQLVLDLRGNGGGLLGSAVDVAGEFLSGGPVLLQLEKGGKEETYEASNGGRFTDGKLVLLVDGGTASAAEIVAGALQDRGRAVLVGEKTYGKGSVQQVFDLRDGSSVHITYADWLTPNRRQITGVGLTPDFEAGITDDDRNNGRDPQLERAIEWLKGN